ncbi:pilus assembly protein TadG-related protein [Vibrio sp. PNB22_2_2]
MRYGKSIATKHSQRGITLVLISLIMLILIGMGAFAIDLNHQVLNKTRLQNAVDSAALASAVVADDTGNALLAKSAAVAALTSFAAASGNQELVYGEENIAITFSVNMQQFFNAEKFEEILEKASDSDIYIRVAVSDVSLTQYLSYIFGVGKDVSASAVAGPSAPITTTCNVAPIGMCGDSDPFNGGPDKAWGYLPNSYYDSKTDKDPSSIHVLKPPSHKDGGIGAGNFHLLDFGSGKNTVRDLLAGATKQCLSVGDKVSTEPGVGTGPVEKGLNTRLETTNETTAEGETIKPDKYLEESNVTYENYQEIYAGVDHVDAFYYADYHSSLASCKAGKPDCNGDYYKESGLEGRRILRVPIIECSDPPKDGGAMDDMKVLGLGCFFITQKTDGKVIFGQFLEVCSVKNASTGISPNDSIGPYKIQLYKDPLSEAS